MDCNGINQRIQKFHESHGAYVCSDGWILYEDGARREKSYYGALIDPPKDLLKRAQNILDFHQEKLNLAVAEFDNFKLNHMGHARLALKQSTVPAPIEAPESVKIKLLELQSKVKEYRKQLNKAQAELEKHLPQRVKNLQEISNKNREANQELLEQIDSIEI
ncbi:MAG: hypothetical protein ISS76_19950 [Phycisphaerae bacterium]|nr:hypothetical protein [Phycisphaerae bacterium]